MPKLNSIKRVKSIIQYSDMLLPSIKLKALSGAEFFSCSINHIIVCSNVNYSTLLSPEQEKNLWLSVKKTHSRKVSIHNGLKVTVYRRKQNISKANISRA